jgi:hypothetical protein
MSVGLGVAKVVLSLVLVPPLNYFFVGSDVSWIGDGRSELSFRSC